MNELQDFTRLFKNVKKNKELNWQEKAILSEIISYQLDGKLFKVKDLTLAIELGMDKGTISKLINRLFKKGLLDKTTVTFPSLEGGKPKRLRTVSVNNIDQWTEKGKTAPTIKPIESKRTKEQIAIDVPMVHEPASQPKKVVEDKSLEVMLKEAETKQVKDAYVKANQNNKDIATLDMKTEVSTILWYYDQMVKQIKSGDVVNFIPVIIRHENGSLTNDEAIKLDNSEKHVIKSKLLKLEPNLFD